MLCKQQQKTVASCNALRRKHRWSLSRGKARSEHVHLGTSVYRVKPSESAALAKKRTTALVLGRRRVSGATTIIR